MSSSQLSASAVIEQPWGVVVAVFGFAFCGLGSLTNQIHQWAHMPAPPAAVRAMQACGLLLGRAGTCGESRTAQRSPLLHHHGMVQPAARCHRLLQAPGIGDHSPHGGGTASRRSSLRSQIPALRDRAEARGDDYRSALRSIALALESTSRIRSGPVSISGIVSAICGIAGLGLVLAVRFPQLFAYAELRPLRSFVFLQAVIHVVLVASFLLGTVSASLRTNKTLALAGIVFTLAAALLGGSQVSRRTRRESGPHGSASTSSSSISC